LPQKGNDLLDLKIKTVKYQESAEMKKGHSTSGSVTISIQGSTSSSIILPSVPVNTIICSSKLSNVSNQSKNTNKDGNLEVFLSDLLKIFAEIIYFKIQKYPRLNCTNISSLSEAKWLKNSACQLIKFVQIKH